MVDEKTKPVEEEIKKDVAKAVETKTEEVKKEVKPVEAPKKDVAAAQGFSLRISPKYTFATCKIIMKKSPEAAIARLEAVIAEKRAVPMAGLEVGHKKGKGLAGGKFPKNVCKAIIDVVKQVAANAVVNGIESPVITMARADRAAAPFRRAGRKAKRTHLRIEVRDKSKLMEKKK
jgi:large subunit ribosomal protein L22